jgi:tetratricopeptide (TPR) repeat protein
MHGRPTRILAGIALYLLFLAPSTHFSQVIAGSPEDKAYQAIARESDVKKRIELLDAFLKNFSKSSDLAQIYEFYANSYRELGDADKEIEYSEKSLALRPDSQLMLMLGRVLAVKGEDLPKAIQTIKDASALAIKNKDNPPTGVSPKEWTQSQEAVISTARQLLDYATDRYKQLFFGKLSSETDPSKVVMLLDEYVRTVDDPETRPLIYEQYVRSYLRLENRAKVLEYGEKALALNPDNIEIIALTASAYLQKPMEIEAAMTQVQKAVTIADALDLKPRPPALTDEQWAKQKNQWKSLAYSTRGLVELQKDESIEAAVTDLEKARDFSPANPLVEYRLGIAYWKSKKIDEAIAALAKSAAVPSEIQTQASQLLEAYYKARHNGSTEGLKELIEKSRDTSVRPNGI